jgi:fructoselysine-6-P-deglycase FrlB-like protein
MNFKHELLNVPAALRQFLEKDRGALEKLVRETRWGEGPLFVLSDAHLLPAGLAAAYAFENFGGWPVVARSALDFRAYALPALRRRSVCVAISASGADPEMLDAVEAARSRGAQIVALTCDPEAALAQTADLFFPVRAAPQSAAESAMMFHAVTGYLAVTAAQLIRRPQSRVREIAVEFEHVPGHLEFVMAQLTDVVRSLAASLKSSASVDIAAAGHYYASALQWRALGDTNRPPAVQVTNAAAYGTVIHSERESRRPQEDSPQRALVAISGSRHSLKKRLAQIAADYRRQRSPVFAITDGSDRELIEHCAMSLLLPVLHETNGALLALAMLLWASHEIEVRNRS